MNKPGILLEVVQVLTDLDLTITKAYISSDGGWFMDGNNVAHFYIHNIIFPMNLLTDSSFTFFSIPCH